MTSTGVEERSGQHKFENRTTTEILTRSRYSSISYCITAVNRPTRDVLDYIS